MFAWKARTTACARSRRAGEGLVDPVGAGRDDRAEQCPRLGGQLARPRQVWARLAW
jgi:hypothetical protein